MAISVELVTRYCKQNVLWMKSLFCDDDDDDDGYRCRPTGTSMAARPW